MMESSNPYSVLLETRHPVTGKLLFKQVRITLACKRPDCRLNPTKCWHQIHRIPPWQSITKHVVAQAMISSSHVAARELCGLVMDEGIKIFDIAHIERFFSSCISNLNVHGTIKFAITAVDPNNDGSSDYAIVTVLVTSRIIVVRLFFCFFDVSGYF